MGWDERRAESPDTQEFTESEKEKEEKSPPIQINVRIGSLKW